MAKVPNLSPSNRGKGYKGASQKPLNIKRPPIPPIKRAPATEQYHCACCARHAGPPA